MREDLITLPGESWSWQRHAKEHLLNHYGLFRILRRAIVMSLEHSTRAERRIRTPARDILQHLRDARLCKEGTPRLSGPDARPDVHWSPAEAIAVIAWHTEAPRSRQQKRQQMISAQGRERLPFRQRRQFAKVDSCCAGTSYSSQTTKTSKQRRKGHRKRCKKKLCCDLRHRARLFRDIKLGGPSLVVRIDSSCSREHRLRNLPIGKLPQFVPVKVASDPRLASVRRRSRCNRQESQDCRPCIMFRTAQ